MINLAHESSMKYGIEDWIKWQRLGGDVKGYKFQSHQGPTKLFKIQSNSLRSQKKDFVSSTGLLSFETIFKTIGNFIKTIQMHVLLG